MHKLPSITAGADISAHWIDVAAHRGGRLETIRFDNDAEGHQALCRWLTRRGRRTRIVLEASGIYSLDLALALHAYPEIEVMVANPRTIKDYAKARMQRSKTDRAEARIICDFAQRMPFVPWHPPEREVMELRQLARRISFATTYTGYNDRLWRGLQSRLPAPLAELPRHRLTEHLVFAVEASCNLWPTLVAYLEKRNFCVVLVSPLSTCHARPTKSGNFSRTDSKDAFLILPRTAREYQGHLGSAGGALHRRATRVASRFPRPKQIERLAGHTNRQKNLVAAMPQLLALVIALMREGQPYEERPERTEEVRRLEAERKRRKKQHRHTRRSSRPFPKAPSAW